MATDLTFDDVNHRIIAETDAGRNAIANARIVLDVAGEYTVTLPDKRVLYGFAAANYLVIKGFLTLTTEPDTGPAFDTTKLDEWED